MLGVERGVRGIVLKKHFSLFPLRDESMLSEVL